MIVDNVDDVDLFLHDQVIEEAVGLHELSMAIGNL
jgi:hypothetical protein